MEKCKAMVTFILVTASPFLTAMVYLAVKHQAVLEGIRRVTQ